MYLIKINLYVAEVSFIFQANMVIFSPEHNKETTNDNQWMDNHEIWSNKIF
jgi:hypothetical protein